MQGDPPSGIEPVFEDAAKLESFRQNRIRNFPFQVVNPVEDKVVGPRITGLFQESVAGGVAGITHDADRGRRLPALSQQITFGISQQFGFKGFVPGEGEQVERFLAFAGPGKGHHLPGFVQPEPGRIHHRSGIVLGKAPPVEVADRAVIGRTTQAVIFHQKLAKQAVISFAGVGARG